MKALISQQRDYINSHSTSELYFRITQLLKLKFLLEHNKDQLNKAIYAGFKKSAFENYITELALLYFDIKDAKRSLNTYAHYLKGKLSWLK